MEPEFIIWPLEIEEFSVESEAHYEALMQLIGSVALDIIAEDPYHIHYVTYVVSPDANPRKEEDERGAF
jgi:hypothetical protein